MQKIIVQDTTLDDIHAFLTNGDISEAVNLLEAVIDTAPILTPAHVAGPGLLDALQKTIRVLVTPTGFPDKGKSRTDEQQRVFDTARAIITIALKQEN